MTMRKVKCKDAVGASVEQLLEEFNERHDEFGITNEEEIISISTTSGPGNSIRLTIFYWSDQ